MPGRFPSNDIVRRAAYARVILQDNRSEAEHNPYNYSNLSYRVNHLDKCQTGTMVLHHRASDRREIVFETILVVPVHQRSTSRWVWLQADQVRSLRRFPRKNRSRLLQSA